MGFNWAEENEKTKNNPPLNIVLRINKEINQNSYKNCIDREMGQSTKGLYSLKKCDILTWTIVTVQVKTV